MWMEGIASGLVMGTATCPPPANRETAGRAHVAPRKHKPLAAGVCDCVWHWKLCSGLSEGSGEDINLPHHRGYLSGAG